MDQLRDANWVLSVGTFLPLAGVLVMLFIPKVEEQLIKAVALITALATLGVGVYTLTQFDYGQAGKMQFVARTNWISVIKSTYYIGIDSQNFIGYLYLRVIDPAHRGRLRAMHLRGGARKAPLVSHREEDAQGGQVHGRTIKYTYSLVITITLTTTWPGGYNNHHEPETSRRPRSGPDLRHDAA